MKITTGGDLTFSGGKFCGGAFLGSRIDHKPRCVGRVVFTSKIILILIRNCLVLIMKKLKLHLCVIKLLGCVTKSGADL